ncbi:hypothetical protein CesoFtcFv8_004643 [Champsocephalus esox]|uniref:Uncharacterized protein n=1 Tax=Champsocephalus esox TaxID=159716 RepID=A0AAN8CNK2_9TELE|nr:hypothetical protein CesoFtcFv8_004643 [Champsocephalus esox]
MKFIFSVPDLDIFKQHPTDTVFKKGKNGVKKHQNVERINFPSVDDDIEERHMGFTHEKEQPDLMNFRFSLPDVDSLQQHQVPLSSPTDSGIYKWNNGVKKHQNGQGVMFPSLDDDTEPSKQRHSGFTHHKEQPDVMNFSFSVPDMDPVTLCPPPVGMPQHAKEKYSVIGFPSLDDEVACLVPLSDRAFDVTVPAPDEDVWESGDTNKKKNPGWQNIGFPSLDDDPEPSKQPKPMTREVSLPLSTDAVFGKENTGVKKHQNVQNIMFPSLEGNSEPSKQRHMGFTRQKEQPDLMNFRFSVPDVDRVQHCQVPLSSPTDARIYTWNNGVKKHQNGQSIMFPSVDDVIKQRHMGFTHQKKQPDLMKFIFSVPDLDIFKQHPTDTVFKKGKNGVKKHQNVERINFPSIDDDIEERHMGFTREKEQPDLMNFRFSLPDVDSLQQHQVPLYSPTDSGFYKWNNGVKKHQNGQGVMFPSLDDDTEPSKQRHSGFTHQKEQPDVTNFSFSVPDVDPVTLCPPPVGMPQHAKVKYSVIGFPSLDDEVACLVPLSDRAFDVTVPAPDDDVWESGDTNKKKNPGWQNIGFPSLDDDPEPSKQPKPMTREVSLPLSTDAVFGKGNTGVKKHQNVQNIMFPSLEGNSEPSKQRHMGFTRQKEQPDLINFRFSVPDVDRVQHCQVPLSSPTDARIYTWNNGVKKHQNGQGVMFPSLHDDTEPSKQRHSGFTHQKEQPDVMNFSFSLPDVDPVTLCPPPVGMPQHAKEKYRDLCAVSFPCLD